MSNCPTENQLKQLLRENLDDTALRETQQHVARCVNCQQVLDKLTQLPDDVRAAVLSPEPDQKDVTLTRLIEELRQNAPTEELTSGTTRVPDNLAGYQIIEEIARGGSGTLYRAHDPRLGRDVAIKVLHGTGELDTEATRRLQREAQAIAALDHPNIVRLFDISNDQQGRPFLVMEYVEGETLADEMQREEILAPRRAAELARDIANALAAAHDKSLIHRDVKPSNLLLNRDRDVVKLTDFGLVLDEDVNTRLTRDGTIAGTPNYMSPEQIRNPHFIDHRSDIHSLGAVLYEMLTGQTPFGGAQRMTMMQILHDEPKSPRTLNDAVSLDLETICLKALEKEPPRRYATARDMAVDLDHWLNDRPIAARPVGAPERVVRWCRKNPRVASLAATIVLLLALLSAGAAITALRMQKLRNTANQQRDIALGTLQSMVYEVYERLDEEGDPATYEAQRELLQTALRGLERFPSSTDRVRRSDSQVGEEVDWIRVAANVRLGIIQYRMEEDESAKRLILDALQESEELGFDTDPRNVTQYRRVRPLSYAHFVLAQILDMEGDIEGSAAHFQQSVDLDEGLLASAPDNLEYLSDLLSSLSVLADIQFEREEFGRCIQSLERCDTLIDRIIANDTDEEYEVEYTYRPSICLTFGQVLLAKEDESGARSKFEEAIAILESDYDPEVSDPHEDSLLQELSVELIGLEMRGGNRARAIELQSNQVGRLNRLDLVAKEWEDDDLAEWVAKSRVELRDATKTESAFDVDTTQD